MTARGRKRAAPVVEAVTTAPLTVTGPGWELRRGSCLDPVTGLASLADRSVAHAFQDPPYDEHTHSATRRGHTGYAESESSARATLSRSTSLGFDAITAKDMAETGRQIARVVRGWAGTFCSVEMVSDWRRHFEAGGMDYVRTAAWRKIGSTPQFSGDRPATAFEAIVLAHPRGRKMCELVADFTDPDDLILDPFAGSGTTAIAALMLGRRFVGWERDANYHAIATRRINGDEAKPREEQPSLFGSIGGAR